MRLSLVFAACFLFFSVAYSQKNLQEGVIVLSNNDTLTGMIDYREWYKNPVSISFAPSGGKTTQRYKVQDLRYFAVKDREMYQRYEVKVSMDRYTGNLGDKDTSSKTDIVFLKILQQGKNVTLFSYADEVKKRLYILAENETVPVELKNSAYLLNEQAVNEREYRPFLLAIANRFIPDAIDIQALIYNSNYSPNDINDICYHINGINKKTVRQAEKNKPAGFRFFAGIGANRGSLNFKGNNHYSGNTDEVTYGLVVLAGADLLMNPAVGKLFLRSQLSFSNYQTNGYYSVKYFVVKENYYLRLKQNNIALHEQLNYNFYSGPSFKWFAGAGAGFNFSSYPLNEEKFISEGESGTTTTVNSNYADKISKFWLNACVLTGISAGKFEASVAYYPPASISQYANQVIANSSIQLHVKYILGK